MFYSQLYNNMVTKLSINIKIIIIGVILMTRLETCGAELRILGGRDALKDEFPFAIRLEAEFMEIIGGTKHFVYEQFCTGAALTPAWILTAAHCDDDDIGKLFDNQLVTLKPRKFARYNSYFPQELGQLSPITMVLAHPSYSIIKIDSITRTNYDVALYQTEKIVTSTYGKISAIDYTTFVGHEAIVLGFGGTNATPTEKPLQVLKGMLVKCDVRLNHDYGMLCVVPRCGLDATICGGDSGGPVVHASGIVAVTTLTFGGCDEFGYELTPGRASAGVTMVSPVIDWISNVIANKSDRS